MHWPTKLSYNKNVVLRIRYFRRIVLACLLALILAIRFVPYGGEFYATYLYPGISFCLSFASSFIQYSLEEIIVCFFAVAFLLYPIIALLCKRHHILWGEIEIVLWLITWFYLGWGCNYFRTGFYERIMIIPAEFSQEEFQIFLEDYTDSLNASYLPATKLNRQDAREEIKALYQKVPVGYGLTKPRIFQEPKQLLFNELYSEVNVLGFMGPFMAESQLNQELSDLEYPFTYAHELAHLLGISNEAEANYWAFTICNTSKDPVIRYSAYLSLLSYVAQNTRMAFTKEKYEEWLNSLKPEVVENERQIINYWKRRKNSTLNTIQETLYNLFLKSNNIQNGIQNYSEVLSMLISVKESQKEPLRRQGRALSVKQ